MTGAAFERAKGRAENGGGETPRLFQIGFQKCGTTSIAMFLDRSGIPCVHYDRGRLARRMRDNLASGARPLAGYEHYAAFANMNLSEADDYFDGFRHYLELRKAYGGRFILNIRPVEHWVRSVMAHKRARLGERGALAHYELRFGTTDPGRVAQCWEAAWDAHHRAVRADLPADVLLEFDIESDPPSRLCDFVGVPRTCARYYRQENPSMNRLGRFVGACVPLAVKQWIPNRMKQPVKRLLRVR